MGGCTCHNCEAHATMVVFRCPAQLTVIRKVLKDVIHTVAADAVEERGDLCLYWRGLQLVESHFRTQLPITGNTGRVRNWFRAATAAPSDKDWWGHWTIVEQYVGFSSLVVEHSNSFHLKDLLRSSLFKCLLNKDGASEMLEGLVHWCVRLSTISFLFFFFFSKQI